MAAKLKKRALAEFSHVIQEEPRPVKRLRLVQTVLQLPEVQLNLSSSSSVEDVLQALVNLEHSFPLENSVAERIFPELIEQFGASRQTLVRCKILSLFSRIATVPGFNPQVISDQLLPLLKTEESQKVKTSILSVLITIGCCLPNSLTFHNQLVGTAHRMLSSSSHLVRARCLELIGELGVCEDNGKEVTPTDSTLSVLGQYTADDDPRVRTAAFTAMLRMYERGQSLSQSVYGQACSGLSDDSEDVRRKATKLVWVFSHLYPESQLSRGSGEGEDLRLVDDGFARICNMMNDLSVSVRVQAATLLGSMRQVSVEFLEQTLDKKLMSNMRRKVSAHERVKKHLASVEWSTGQQWADDQPRESLQADSICLMNIGACGAFIHGLEDEFLEVRNAALDSLCELAVQSAHFALLSQDSVIDMVNDEIESVRLNALHSLQKLSNHLTLKGMQLDIVLGVLQDFSFTSRAAVRDLLAEIRLGTRNSVKITILALLENMLRYPQDRTSIYRCSQCIGKHHSQVMMMLAEELLCLHPYFDSPEPNTEDPCYITVMLAVFSAAAVCPTLVSLFPEHTRRHYTYLRCSLPDLMPAIQALDDAEKQAGDKLIAVKTTGTRDFLQQLLDSLAELSSLDLQSAEKLLRICVQDLERVEALDSQMSAAAEFLSMYLSTQLILTELIQGTMKSDMDKVYQEYVTASTDKILHLTTLMQTIFLGVGGELTALVWQTEVKALALQLLFRLERSSLGEKVRASTTFRDYMTLIKSVVDSDAPFNVAPWYDNFTRQAVSLVDTLDWSQLQLLPSVFRSLNQLLRPCTLTLPCHVRRVRAVIEEPPASSDNVIKFPALMATAITMVVTLYNLEDTNSVSLKVQYPDQRIQFVIPALCSWTRLGPLTHRLVTPVTLSHGLWSESCYVELSVVVESGGFGRQLLKLQDHMPLTKPVRVQVVPKPLAR